MATALKRYNGGRVLVFVVGAFVEMSEDVSRICDITAQDLARTHVSYYNDDTKRTKGMYRQLPRHAQPLLLLFRSNPRERDHSGNSTATIPH